MSRIQAQLGPTSAAARLFGAGNVSKITMFPQIGSILLRASFSANLRFRKTQETAFLKLRYANLFATNRQGECAMQ